MSEAHLTLASVVNFLVLAGGLGYLVRKPLMQFVGERHETVKKAVNDAEELRIKVEAMMKEYQGKLARLDSEIAQITSEAKAEAEVERRRILERAKLQAQRILEEAERSATKLAERTQRKLEAEVVTKAVAQARKSLEARVSAGDHQLFVNELVSNLEAASDQKR